MTSNDEQINLKTLTITAFPDFTRPFIASSYEGPFFFGSIMSQLDKAAVTSNYLVWDVYVIWGNILTFE